MTQFDYLLIAIVIIGLAVWGYDALIAESRRKREIKTRLKRGDWQIEAKWLQPPSWVEHTKFVLSIAVIVLMFRHFTSATAFSLLLIGLTLATTITVLIDRWFWRPKREAMISRALDGVPDIAEPAVKYLYRESGWVEFSRGVYWLFLLIVVVRSFIYEPFRIPSGSMKPTLEVGDMILVNKFAYGLRLPVLDAKILPIGEPKRGDIFVFHYPEDPEIDYIKRVVGLPGDRIVIKGQTLFIQPACRQEKPCPPLQQIPTKLLAKGGYVERDGSRWDIYEEDLLGVKHKILHHPFLTRPIPRQACMAGDGEWVVPDGHYFAMGDNRENSRDSRFWCFVPEKYLVGRADFIWMHFDTSADSWFDFSRIGPLE